MLLVLVVMGTGVYMMFGGLVVVFSRRFVTMTLNALGWKEWSCGSLLPDKHLVTEMAAYLEVLADT